MSTPAEELRLRHRTELKNLQAVVTSKKKNASKKTRRGVNEECDTLERSMRARHERERADLSGNSVPDVDDLPELEAETEPSTANERVDTPPNEPADPNIAPEQQPVEPKRRNRAKEKLARRAAEQEAAVAQAKVEAANQPSQRDLEQRAMVAEIKARGLVEKSISPDGHCLFSSVADQLRMIGVSLGEEGDRLSPDEVYAATRKAAASYIEMHPNDFVPYLEDPLEVHVRKIRDTAEWGGHPELLALARTFGVEICVIQYPGPIAYIKPDLKEDEKPAQIWLSFYRYSMGLGEHYNSLHKKP